MNRLDLQTGLFHEPFHVIGMVHLAVSVGDSCEIEAVSFQVGTKESC